MGKADQKSFVVDDLVKQHRPLLGDIATHAIEYALHPPAGLRISGYLGLPGVGLAELKFGEPRQQFLPFAYGKRLHMLGDLFDPVCHFLILAIPLELLQYWLGPRENHGLSTERAAAGMRRLLPQKPPAGPSTWAIPVGYREGTLCFRFSASTLSTDIFFGGWAFVAGGNAKAY